jgi:hypothetical protein
MLSWIPEGQEWTVIIAILAAPFATEFLTKLLSLYRNKALSREKGEAKGSNL